MKRVLCLYIQNENLFTGLTRWSSNEGSTGTKEPSDSTWNHTGSGPQLEFNGHIFVEDDLLHNIVELLVPLTPPYEFIR